MTVIGTYPWPSPDGSGILLFRRTKDKADSRKQLLIASFLAMAGL